MQPPSSAVKKRLFESTSGPGRALTVEQLEPRRLLSSAAPIHGLNSSLALPAVKVKHAKVHAVTTTHPKLQLKPLDEGKGKDKGKGNGSSDGEGNGNSGDGSGGSTSNGAGNESNADHIPPSTTISAANVTQTTPGDEMVTVVFSDASTIDASTLTASKLTVAGPANLTVSGTTVSQNGTTQVTAVFTVAAPSGGWVLADNGSYTLTLAAGAAFDSSHNASLAAIGSFQVNLPQPAGSLDPGFGASAAVTEPFIAESIAAQPDGKLLLAGHQGDLTVGQSLGVVEQLNADGSIDPSFGSGGKIATAAGKNDAFFSMVSQPDGHFIVAGTTSTGPGSSAFLLERFDASGKVDTTFGTGGRTITDFGGTVSVAYAATLTSNDGIVIGGTVDGRFAFAEYDSQGHPDPSFGQSGRELFALGNGSDAIGAVAITSGGKIVAAGASGTHVVVIQMASSGTPDTSFGSQGVVTVPGLVTRQEPGVIDHSEGLAINANGDILIANQTANGHFGLVQLSGAGALDTGFGANGLATADFGGIDHADQILLDSSGEILVLGTSASNGTTSATIAAFDQSGSPVLWFGNGGLVEIAPNAGTVTRELHIGDIVLHSFGVEQNGKLVLGTSAQSVTATPSTTSTTLRRILISPQPVSDPITSTQQFGLVKGKQQSATFLMPDGTMATFALQGGTGTAEQIGNRVRLLITASALGAAVSSHVFGGSHTLTLDDVTVTGALRSFKGANTNLAGALYATGTIGSLSLGRVMGTIASGAGSIANLAAASLAGAHVLSGANLGADSELGGSGSAADTFAAGVIGSIRISGTVSTSVIGAGLDPVDGVFLNGNDKVIGAVRSLLRSIVVQGGVDTASRFVAGAFLTARIPKTAVITTDSHFLKMS